MPSAERSPLKQAYDVVVVGSGAGGLAAAITARKAGLEVLVLEKEPMYGGTTARSGGVLWIPGHGLPQSGAPADDLESARSYLMSEAGAQFDAERVDAFLREGPRMVDFFTSQTDVRFVPVPEFSDYHPQAPGGRAGGRSILAAPYDAGLLGSRVNGLRPPLREITFVGMMFNASQEVTHFFRCTRSLTSALYVTKRLLKHAWEMAVFRRPQRLTNGNALVARLAKSAFDCGVELALDTPVVRLFQDGQRVSGVEAQRAGVKQTILARRGVVLAAGGFPQDRARRKALFPHAPTGEEHLSPAPPGNTGDGLRLATGVGAALNEQLPNAAAWIPVSRVSRGKGNPPGVFPHLIDRYKPGIIAVSLSGRRFTNEANSYHDVGQAMIEEGRGRREGAAFLVCDHAALRRYGMGYVKPFPLPLFPHIRSRYLLRGLGVRDLALEMGVDPATLERTIADFNIGARQGEDTEFGRGSTSYNRFLGDAENKPNPCVAPIAQGPYYAIRVEMGDLGTFAGIKTDARARAIDEHGRPVPGLYAVGNDAASVMGGAYPGGGITLGPAMTFGFIAGRDLASTAVSPQQSLRTALEKVT